MVREATRAASAPSEQKQQCAKGAEGNLRDSRRIVTPNFAEPNCQQRNAQQIGADQGVAKLHFKESING